jgi:hypothetical protein
LPSFIYYTYKMHSPKQVSLDCQTPDGLQMVKVIAGLEQEEENEFSGEDEVVVVNKKDKKDKKKKSTREEETEPSNYEKLKVLFIDVVNPKFKNFNRPLFLALVVGGITLAAFIALFVYLQTDCVSQSMTGATPQVTMFFEKNPIKCIHFAAKVEFNEDENKLDIPMCKLVNYPLKEEEPITPSDIPYCNSGITEGQNLGAADDPNCTGAQPDDGSKPDPALTIVEFDICPDPVLTLGSAFGWVAIIELATTLFVLALGMPAGFLVNDQSTLKTLIGEINAEENKAAIQGAATMARSLSQRYNFLTT